MGRLLAVTDRCTCACPRMRVASRRIISHHITSHRRPAKPYIEKIWDHAAGQIVVEEAGGKV